MCQNPKYQHRMSSSSGLTIMLQEMWSEHPAS
eukprot:CAMPEP_0184296038 /NCGR_PEP_ID=MMETSP1049-20130417/7003_1 /TAXON_ID=77928 /ORGANISM="Proteomonas sulcata, Strain CCMP704" /LENGTH=31 /DNA_ID= /DNA_START= /DNA_END= /DNA_ORIENTATION=